MKCQQAQRQLSEWVDKALSPAQMQAIEQHVADCHDCSEEMRRLQSLKQLLALKRHERPDSIYAKGMLDEFHRRLVAQRSARRAARWAIFDTVGLQHWWERTQRILKSHPLLALRYGLATALVAVLILNAAVLMLASRQHAPKTVGEQPEGIVASPTYMLERLPASAEGDSVPF